MVALAPLAAPDASAPGSDGPHSDPSVEAGT
jgi:hypothetical protein